MLCRPMKKIRCRLSAELHEMLSRMSLFTLILCFAAALLPSFLLSALIAWKAVFFPLHCLSSYGGCFCRCGFCCPPFRPH